MAGVAIEGLDIGLPYIGMEVEYEFAFAISRKANGSRIVQDLGASRDVVYTTAQFRLTTAKAKQLLNIWASRERDAFTVVWPDGTFPLGPCYPNGRQLDMDILDISGDVTMDSPWRMCEVTIKLMCSIVGQTTSTATQIPQGNLSIGGYDGFTYPKVSTDIAYGVKREAQGSNRAQMSAMRPPLDEVACSTWSFDIPQSNAGNLQGVLIDSRGGNVDVTSAVSHTIWGVRTPYDGGFGTDGYDGQARQVSKSIVMQQTAPLRWSLKVTVEQADDIDYSLIYLDEAEIAMLTTDASSGESMFTLSPVFSDSGSHSAACTWSSDSAQITVDSVGKVTCLVSGAAVTATISCTLGATTKTCSVTGYATLPSFSALESVKGGTGPGERAPNAGYIAFFGDATPTTAMQYGLIIDKHYTPTVIGGGEYILSCYTVNVGGIALFMQTGVSSVYPCSAIIGADNANIAYNWNNPLSYDTQYTSDLSITPSGAEYNGSVKSLAFSVNNGYIDSSLLAAFWRNNTRKVTAIVAHDLPITRAQLGVRTNCKLFYIPQNFIRYTDQGSRVNYTVIPNMGTLGASYNLTANNVPSGWFGV